jgi:hypothetical protein
MQSGAIAAHSCQRSVLGADCTEVAEPDSAPSCSTPGGIEAATTSSPAARASRAAARRFEHRLPRHRRLDAVDRLERSTSSWISGARNVYRRPGRAVTFVARSAGVGSYGVAIVLVPRLGRGQASSPAFRRYSPREAGFVLPNRESASAVRMPERTGLSSTKSWDEDHGNSGSSRPRRTGPPMPGVSPSRP